MLIGGVVIQTTWKTDQSAIGEGRKLQICHHSQCSCAPRQFIIISSCSATIAHLRVSRQQAVEKAHQTPYVLFILCDAEWPPSVNVPESRVDEYHVRIRAEESLVFSDINQAISDFHVCEEHLKYKYNLSCVDHLRTEIIF